MGKGASPIFFSFVFPFVFLSVFPATSVDYSSFADRCNSWIEFIKLKAQTIRRGSIKTSRRSFLPHSDHWKRSSDLSVANGGASYPVVALQNQCPSVKAADTQRLFLKTLMPG